MRQEAKSNKQISILFQNLRGLCTKPDETFALVSDNQRDCCDGDSLP